ncbi:hypothetical protein PUV47_08700 [Pseudovibrio exalbescens]|uniref:hypothetical protein n=1 Tax=Pseudovibrio exalbescens TaxID=197461 RepID=UPI0023666357|nr:hypothetical protein [Pseudovibrio exalbescens]MDD7909995.1 hypothetical protein [Pseudovibrio exalbescens]
MAWVVLEYGDVYAPIFYRLKAELEAWKCPKEEAEKYLQDRLAEGKPPHLPKPPKQIRNTKL